MTGSGANRLSTREIFIDEDGDWFHLGNRIFRPEILELLYAKLDRLPSGEFILRGGEEVCLVDVADTPFVIYRVDLNTTGAGEEHLVLSIRHIGQVELLDPETLWVGKNNVLYCRIFERRFPARFSRPAYYQLAEFVRESQGGEGFCIVLNEKEYRIG
ncbi:MAG: hypothetical protein AB9866_08975 [Syntrophobacteraceae bacterium]